jgi:hypothetical protein
MNLGKQLPSLKHLKVEDAYDFVEDEFCASVLPEFFGTLEEIQFLGKFEVRGTAVVSMIQRYRDIDPNGLKCLVWEHVGEDYSEDSDVMDGYEEVKKLVALGGAQVEYDHDEEHPGCFVFKYRAV